MKHLSLIQLVCLSVMIAAANAHGATPTQLLGPVDWRFEAIPAATARIPVAADHSPHTGDWEQITPEEDINTKKHSRPLLGVQRRDMYSGIGATQRQELGDLPGKQGFLKDPQWHVRAPFFCRLTADVDWVAHPAEAGPLWFNYPFSQELLQASMDQDIRLAFNAGIDFSFISTYESEFLNRGLPFIPPCTSMQYPWPRALDKQTGMPKDRWYHYQWPQPGDLAARITAAFDFVVTHAQACEAQVVTIYSWNEHSEGGGLCPTMGPPPEYQPVTQWLDEVAAALAGWRYPIATMQEDTGS